MLYDLRFTIGRRALSAFCFLLSAMAVFAQPIKYTGWTTTTNPATARAALGLADVVTNGSIGEPSGPWVMDIESWAIDTRNQKLYNGVEGGATETLDWSNRVLRGAWTLNGTNLLNGGGGDISATSSNNILTVASNTAAGLDLVLSNHNVFSLDSLKRDNYWQASSLGLPHRYSLPETVKLTNEFAHGFLYVAADGVLRTTNYLFVLHRASASPSYLTRMDADSFTNRVTIPLPGTNDTGNALLFVRNKVYAQGGTTGNRLYVAMVDPVTMAATNVINDASVSSAASGGFATDGNYLYHTEADSSSVLRKYSLDDYSLVGQTNLYSGIFGFPRNVHALLYDGVYVWGSSFASDSGLVRVDPATLGYTRIPFQTNGVFWQNFLATDDMCETPDALWVGSEDTNGILARVSKTDLSVAPIFTGVTGMGIWATFFDGTHVWAALNYNTYNTNRGQLCRINPDTLSVDVWETQVGPVNELQSDGQRLFATTFFDTQTNTSGPSWVMRSPLREHVLTGQANTNGTLTWSVDLRSGVMSGNGSGLTNLNASQLTSGTVPSARLTGASITNATLVGPTTISGVLFSGSGVVNFGGMSVTNATNFSVALNKLRIDESGRVQGGNGGWNLSGAGVNVYNGGMIGIGSSGSPTFSTTSDTGFTRASAGVGVWATNFNAIGTITATNGLTTVNAGLTNGGALAFTGTGQRYVGTNYFTGTNLQVFVNGQSFWIPLGQTNAP